MTVGELRQLLDGVDDDLEIVVRAWDDAGSDYCGGISGAQVELAHDEDCSPYFALDCCQDDDEEEAENTSTSHSSETTSKTPGNS